MSEDKDVAKEKKPKVAKQAVPVEKLVEHALRLAAMNPKAKWLGKSNKALFDQNEPNYPAAIGLCLTPDSPLLRQVGTGGILTETGFDRVFGELKEDQVASLAASVAGGLTVSDRPDFLRGVISRTPLAATELTPLIEEAVAAEKAADEARVVNAAKRTAAEEAAKAALERAKQLIDERRKNRLDALRREWEALGGKATELPEHKHAPKVEKPEPKEHSPVPRTAQEKDFRRDTAERLISVWLYNTRHQKVETATALERVLRGINGVVALGRVGEQVAFDGRIHECERGVSDGAQVRVVLPGWAFEGEPGEPLRRALVE